jgi:hypothetical protein
MIIMIAIMGFWTALTTVVSGLFSITLLPLFGAFVMQFDAWNNWLASWSATAPLASWGFGEWFFAFSAIRVIALMIVPSRFRIDPVKKEKPVDPAPGGKAPAGKSKSYSVEISKVGNDREEIAA